MSRKDIQNTIQNRGKHQLSAETKMAGLTARICIFGTIQLIKAAFKVLVKARMLRDVINPKLCEKSAEIPS